MGLADLRKVLSRLAALKLKFTLRQCADESPQSSPVAVLAPVSLDLQILRRHIGSLGA